MDQDQKRSKLALAEGFVVKTEEWDYLGEQGTVDVWKRWDNAGNVLENGRPDYFRDLNAVRRARERLLTTEDLQTSYISHLAELVVPPMRGIDESIYELANATAEQMAEALGLTLGLWELEQKP